MTISASTRTGQFVSFLFYFYFSLSPSLSLSQRTNVILGLLRRVTREGLAKLELLLEQQGKPIPEVRKKKFMSKYEHLKLEDYSVDPGEGFWSQVGHVSWEEMKDKGCKIDVRKLEEYAVRTGYPYESILEKVVEDLSKGAKIGVAEACRVSSRSTNAPSALEHGQEVTEALFDWLGDEFAIGPYDEENIPFEIMKLSGLMCRLKPNGKARIIVNLSKGRPCSVNEGIDKLEFPTGMSSIAAWIRIMLRCDRDCIFTKCDWAREECQISQVTYFP